MIACRAAGMLALAALSSAVCAEEQWRDFSYPEQRFLIQFPTDPVVAKGQYQAVTSSGAQVAVPATTYSVRRGATDYRVTVASLRDSEAQDPKALEHVATALRAGGSVGLDTAVSMSNTSCGRYLGIERTGGTLDYIALFYNRDTHLLYDVRATVPPVDQAEHGADAVHFQQSLGFIADPAAKPAAPMQYPAHWKVHDQARHFAARFPGDPVVEQFTYRTEAGIDVPATRYSVREGETLYRVSVVHVWETQADTDDALEQAVLQWGRQGRLTGDDTISLMNGQCGRDLVLERPDGGLSTAKLFFPSSQHRLYLVETIRDASAGRGARARDDLFRASFTLPRPAEE